MSVWPGTLSDMGVWGHLWGVLPDELKDKLWGKVREHLGESLRPRLALNLGGARFDDGNPFLWPAPRGEVGVTDAELGSTFEAYPDLAAMILQEAMQHKGFRAYCASTEDISLHAVAAGSVPDLVELALLESPGDLAADGNNLDLLLRWAAVTARVGSVPPELRRAAAVADGVRAGFHRARYVADRRGDRGRMRARSASIPAIEEDAASDIAEVVAAAVVCERLFNYGQGLVGDGARREFHVAVQQHPSAWQEALPWLLQILNPRRNELVDGTTIALAADPGMHGALADATAHPIPEIAMRASGLHAVVANLDEAGALSVSAIARRSDRARHEFPRPLAEPSATWLSDLELEAMLCDAVGDARKAFAREFADFAAHEEEGHLRSLMKEIESTLRTRQHIHSISGEPGRAPEVITKYRPYPKSEEHDGGADLALVVAIEVTGRGCRSPLPSSCR
ncbi:hypothetical protein [Nocardia sp. BMG51109]|uniref:hypothetical protein n=1 Tax=Nocardia sp. BMG51109 TaxID=1056816 RepID=UPI0012EC0F1C|nr:hypothetical protein [Nocardia sp. BMG51109]